MAKYKISADSQDVTQSTTLKPERRYGGWMAVNQGNTVASVMGYELQPGEGLNFLDAVPAGSEWDTAIQIIINGVGKVRITRLQALEIK